MSLLKKIFSILGYNNKKSLKNFNNFSFFKDILDISTPMYIINSNFEIIWYNKEFNKFVVNPNANKCYQTIFGSQIICMNCPAVKSFQTQQINDSFVDWIKLSHKKNIIKVTSLPIRFNNNEYVLNSISFLSNFESVIPSKKEVYNGKEISNKEYFLKFLAEQIPLPILFVSKDLKIQFANETAQNEFKFANLNESTATLPSFLKTLEESDFEQLILNVLNNKSHIFRVSFENGIDANRKTYICKIFQIDYDSDFYVMIFKDLSKISNLNYQSVVNLELINKILDRIDLGISLQDEFNRTIFQNKVAQELLENNIELNNQIVLKTLSAKDCSEINFIYPVPERNQIFSITLNECVIDSNNEKYRLLKFENITELEVLKNNLKKIKEHIEPIEKNIHFAAFKLLADFSIIDVFGKFHYFDVDKLLHRNKTNFIEELVFPEDSFKVEETLSELFHFPNITKTLDFRLKTQENDYFWVKGVFENVVDERGKILYVECFLLDINEQKKVEEQLKASQEEMRNLALYFEALREDEKKKLAFEIHDELGHLLTAMKLEMAWLMKKKYLREDVLNEKLLKLTEMVETTIRKVRSISSQLRPSILDHFGVLAAIEWQAKEFQRQTAIRCRINLPKQELQLDEQKSIVVFRVFQEILTNIARHAKATRVDVNLDIVDNNLILTVSDNGKGIKPEDISAKKSLGIIGMKERASSVNGKLSIHGVSNIGTTVTLTIPIK